MRIQFLKHPVSACSSRVRLIRLRATIHHVLGSLHRKASLLGSVLRTTCQENMAQISTRTLVWFGCPSFLGVGMRGLGVCTRRTPDVRVRRCCFLYEFRISPLKVLIHYQYTVRAFTFDTTVFEFRQCTRIR